jgi:hypothetical protein
MRKSVDVGIGGGAIALALILHLIKNNSITADDARSILSDAQKRATAFPDGTEGARIISEIYKSIPAGSI